MTLRLGGKIALALSAAALRAGRPLGTIPSASCPEALLAERVGMFLGQGISTIIKFLPRFFFGTAFAFSAVLMVIVGHD